MSGEVKPEIKRLQIPVEVKTIKRNGYIVVLKK
jgi:hypothetical protein